LFQEPGQSSEHFVVAESTSAILNDSPDRLEERRLNYARKGTVCAYPDIRGISDASLLELERRSVVDVVSKVFLICENLMNCCACPGAIQVGAVPFGVQPLCDLLLRLSFGGCPARC
jgi:hypothetical protein